jgi:putative glycosyltransferase (TIGR04348 family)
MAAATSRSARTRITLVTPYGAAANNGNWQTASRWARMLRGAHDVRIVTAWRPTDPAPDLMIALHAKRSAPSIAAFADSVPQRPLIVVLTGTDLYRDIDSDASARASLQRATRLVTLNPLGPARLPRAVRDKTVTIVQSAAVLAPASKTRGFTAAAVGHLRAEKNPQLIWRVLDGWPADVPLRVLHAGRALDPALARRAQRQVRSDPRYHWLGDQPRGRLRQRVARSQVLFHPSHMEGGALAIIEAITAHTPVIASRVDGNVGLLGADYPGLFVPDDPDAARALLLRAASEPRYLAQLARACERLVPHFAPAREQRDLRRLVRDCLAAPSRR